MGALNLYGLTALVIGLAVLLHYEALQMLSRLSGARGPHRPMLLLVILGLLGAHMAECGVFAWAYGVGVGRLELGRFVSAEGAVTGVRLFHFSVESFTTQGVGDVVLRGPLRLLASVEPLVGLILIGWSTSFTFLFMSRRWGGAQADGAGGGGGAL